MLIGISGFAGSGKDTVAEVLVKKYQFVGVALADPLKRFCMETLLFSEEQLWGPSRTRAEPDKRFPRKVPSFDAGDAFEAARVGLEDPGKIEYLTPRYALQKLGTEWGRDCYSEIWADYAIRVYRKLQLGDCYYDAVSGLRSCSFVGQDMMQPKTNVVITDCRFKNEMDALRREGGKLVRVKRPGVDAPQWFHRSETEMLALDDGYFDWVFQNDVSLPQEAKLFESKVTDMLATFGW
jgi:hypothetical protein